MGVRVALACLTVLAACTPVAPAIGLTLGTEAAAVARGATVDVDVVVARVGAAHDAIELGVAGLPDGVTASFAPMVLTGAARTSTVTFAAVSDIAEGTWNLTVTATSGALEAQAALGLAVTGPQPVTATGSISNWNAGTPPFEAGTLAGRDALALKRTPWVAGAVDAVGDLTITYGVPTGIWGSPLEHLFDDPLRPGSCTGFGAIGLDQPALVVLSHDHEVHGGAIMRNDAADDAYDLMVYVAAPATVAATSCHVLLADVVVDVRLTVGWNRLRLGRGQGTLLVGHDPDAVWIWE